MQTELCTKEGSSTGSGFVHEGHGAPMGACSVLQCLEGLEVCRLVRWGQGRTHSKITGQGGERCSQFLWQGLHIWEYQEMPGISHVVVLVLYICKGGIWFPFHKSTNWGYRGYRTCWQVHSFVRGWVYFKPKSLWYKTLDIAALPSLGKWA
jgi:hypothetical protein